MKKIITVSVITLGLRLGLAQNTIADFESFGIPPNSAYTSTNSSPFQTSNAVFEYDWLSSFGGYWVGGFAYTNKYDSSTAGFSNLYGVKPLKGHNGSGTYVIGQDGGTIRLKSPNARVNGFYITNTTYAFKSVRNGDAFARKFGDTTGTGSGTTIPQGSYPDFFKVTSKGFMNGNMKTDSAVFYLADYRFSNNTQDYVVSTWQYFDLSVLGIVDSIAFNMYSSDNSAGYLNTPAFFAMDDFSTSPANPLALAPGFTENALPAFPNPFSSFLKLPIKSDESTEYMLRDQFGKILKQGSIIPNKPDVQTDDLPEGLYYLILINSKGTSEQTLIKAIQH